MAIDDVSKWVEAQALPTNEARVVLKFLKKLFSLFGTPKALISDRGTHFCNALMEKLLACYGDTHHLSTAYHPKTSGQVENANRDIKRILKKIVGKNRKDWSDKLDDAFWAFRTAYKTPLGTTPFMIVYGKACHLPVELEHRALWALKTVNLDMTEAARKHFFQIHELEELRDVAYARSWGIKEKTKIEVICGKLKSKWSGPYMVHYVFPYGAVEIMVETDGRSWKVNGHRLKHYIGGAINKNEMEETPLEIPSKAAN
ncbi:KRAB-A domain-containing protein 2-like [Helianthus annuus]|uniref:KRAB-A domain-containing protein 2-like n=1 Tax=Helianthus annuus TaxID=4232 RepID=UPI000B8F5FE3|nr:KRAB-A domain-containing protein 2-like [Helianthus annuus]